MKSDMPREYKEFWTMKFNENLDKWKHYNSFDTGEKYCDKDFADAINIYLEDHDQDPKDLKNMINQVSAYRKGRIPDPKMREVIYDLFCCDEEDFSPLSKRDLYRSNSDHINKIIRNNRDYAVKYGLSPLFVDALHDIVTEFDDVFPIYAPIEVLPPEDALFGEDPIVRRVENSDSAEALDSSTKYGNLSSYQIVKDGKIITMSEEDLDYLIDVQDKVYEYVLLLFNQRKKEMIEEEKEVFEKVKSKMKTIGSDGVETIYAPENSSK